MQVLQAIPEDISRFAAPVRSAVEFCLVILLAIMAARLVWLVIAPISAVAILDQRPLPALMSDRSTRLTVDRTILARSNPFETTGEVVVEVPTAPETKLNLRLAGLVMSTDAFGGSAQITTPDNKTARYAIGDEILPGVELERVLSDRVIINRNGASETLLRGSRGEGLAVIGDGNQVVDTASAENSAPARAIEGRAESPAALLQTIQPSPLRRDGRLYGYVLSLRGASDALVATGLASGDILLQINETRVSQLDIQEMANKISGQERVVLEIERAGVPLTVTLLFESV
ncbi:MAG: hypothetical protein Hens3KO_07920 [Henriciella sp.]